MNSIKLRKMVITVVVLVLHTKEEVDLARVRLDYRKSEKTVCPKSAKATRILMAQMSTVVPVRPLARASNLSKMQETAVNKCSISAS